MKQPDVERLGRTRTALADADLDALVLRLPENILWLSGYWPMNGFAALILPTEGDPILLAPEPEAELAADGWVSDIRTFPWGLVDSGDPFETMGTLLKQAASGLDLKGSRIGYEERFEFVASPFVGAEPGVIAGRSIELIRIAFGDAVVDATGLIHNGRKNKTAPEIERLRLANEVARFGLEAFRENVVPGRSEIEIAAAVESAILTRGTGYKGVRAVRAWASVLSGPRAAYAYKPYLLPTTRRLDVSDLALLELAVVADGWWSDLTRTRVAGAARPQDLERWQVVVKAQQSACRAIAPGIAGNVVDKAAREIIGRNGLGQYFVHHTGHGLGLRYHEPEPFLHPAIETPLEVGMLTSVEPGIYIEGWGGMRCEDNVLVTEDGREILSEFSRELEG